MFKLFPDKKHRDFLRELSKKNPDKLGYYGVQKYFMIHGAPDIIWRAYWWLQPIRCIFGFHNWYDVLAGEAVSCNNCKRGFRGYHKHLVQKYRFKPWLIKYIAQIEDANYRAEFWQERYFDTLKEQNSSEYKKSAQE